MFSYLFLKLLFSQMDIFRVLDGFRDGVIKGWLYFFVGYLFDECSKGVFRYLGNWFWVEVSYFSVISDNAEKICVSFDA